MRHVRPSFWTNSWTKSLSSWKICLSEKSERRSSRPSDVRSFSETKKKCYYRKLVQESSVILL